MKIISRLNKERFHVTMSGSELANLMGVCSQFDLKSDDLDKFIKTEIDIPISDIYNQHKRIKAFQDYKGTKESRENLLKLLNALTPIENKVEKLSLIAKGIEDEIRTNKNKTEN